MLLLWYSRKAGIIVFLRCHVSSVGSRRRAQQIFVSECLTTFDYPQLLIELLFFPHVISCSFLSQIQKLIYALQCKGRQRLHCFTLSYVYKSNGFLTFYSYRYSCSSYSVTKAEII